MRLVFCWKVVAAVWFEDRDEDEVEFDEKEAVGCEIAMMLVSLLIVCPSSST